MKNGDFSLPDPVLNDPQLTPSRCRTLSRPTPHLLLIDDDEIMCEILASILGQAGIRVSVTTTGQQALEQLSRSEAAMPDIILLDIVMPMMDGYTTCERIRALPRGRHLPVLMMTSYEQDRMDSIDRAYEAGATDFIAKPINTQMLLHRIRYMVRAGEITEELYHSQRRLAATQRMARIGHWEYSCDTGEIFWSEQALSVIGIQSEEQKLDFPRFLSNIPAQERTRVQSWFEMLKSIHGPTELTHRIFGPNGEELHLRQFIEPRDPQAREHSLLYGAVQDITPLREAEAHIHRLVSFDYLTGLPNRTFFLRHFDLVLQRARQQKGHLALLFLDLDNFKKVNDTLGYRSGDLLLQSVAERLLACLRAPCASPCDRRSDERYHLARLGGDEFTLLLPEISSGHEAAHIAQRIIDALTPPFSLDGEWLVISPSIGITLFPEDGNTALELMRTADMAMYHAKRAGKNTYRFFSSSLNDEAVLRLKLENALRQAITNQEFRLVYQPQVNAYTGELCGVEALLRWSSPELGEMLPEDFIPIAEETGLILPMGKWALHTACHQLEDWHARGVPVQRMAVNVSAAQFTNHEFPRQVERILSETGLSPEVLELELTETILMSQVRASEHILHQLKVIGVQLAIDDFGTGYSSLSYLKRFPIDRLKIDKSFITNLDSDIDNVAIVQAIIAMAKTLSLEVTAEGVESNTQLEFLRNNHCHELQGFLFSEPVPADSIEQLLLNPASTQLAHW